MKNGLLWIAAAVAVVCYAGTAQADSLAYSFENALPAGPDGFFGLGATVTQDTIGATEGAYSMKYDVGAGGFVGARTETVIPADLNDPPGVSHVLFDMTLADQFTGGFAVIGVTLFGHALNAPGGAEFGHQVQFFDTVAIDGRAAGTYEDLRIDLDLSQGPYRPGESFNAIFGPGPTDLTVASAFQFYINKSADAPVTVYIDNVRLVIPEPATGMLFGLGAIALGMVARRRR